MSIAEFQPILVLLLAKAGQRRGSENHADHRRIVPEASLLRAVAA
jgi:hypothetical protein